MKKRSGQNFIEFVMVFPLLILFLFATVELAFYGMAIAGTQNLANQIASNTAIYANLLEPNPNEFFTAIKDRLETGKLYHSLTGKEMNFTQETQNGIVSLVTPADASLPAPFRKITVTIDTQYVDENVIDTKVTYIHETLLLRASYALPNGKVIEVIPSQVVINSSWVRQYLKY